MTDRTHKSAIEVRDVSKVFGSGDSPFRALDHVSVDIRENEFFTLLGPSGCGKTTLLRMIAGFTYPTDGEIRLHGEDIAALPPYRRPVNTVFQSYALFPHMTVGENIAFGLEMLDRPKAEIAKRVEEMLALVKMGHLKDRKTAQISGGQQQRVALARALAPQPKVLLLDEPLSALDYKLRKDMQIELKRLQTETGITFIFVTHDQEEALTMSDRIAVMSAGKILQVGGPRDIYDRPAERFVAEFIGETNFLTAEVVSVAGDKADIVLPGGTRVTARLPEGFAPAGKVTVVTRPEHAAITANPEGAHLRGTLASVVYVGTDTHFHIALESGESFCVRRQNSLEQGTPLAEGDVVGVVLETGAAQVLKD
ncbi:MULTISPECIES: ABC transporter ATP-binding protein [Hyphomicrobiales]|uniref:ABC transporter ATP-binding protein n=1 Tax=Hyphomicrobiales TaxID=356 RepID=UPI00273F2003|nr:ABC transporter ATP-binding protein [Shinella zoogloeoides]WLR91967.1 ABC transporter ATP-binding protein [Shinella zoogloeoides]